MAEHPSHHNPDGDDGSRTALARELTGDLPCVSCRYNLRGLSIRSNCPECGVPVRATILAVVDPRAGELAPVSRPRVTAGGLALWGVGAAGAALALWIVRVGELSGLPWNAVRPFGWAVLVGAGLSGLGALVLIRPQEGTRRRYTIAALVGVLAYLPLVWLLWRLIFVVDPARATPYTVAIPPVRSELRLAIAAAMVVVILGLRPNARALASRWVLMRTGRVDRQQMLAVLFAVLVAAVGDLIHLLPWAIGEIGRLVGTVLIAAGSMFITFGLLGIAYDVLRLRRVVAQRVRSLDDLTGREP